MGRLKEQMSRMGGGQHRPWVYLDNSATTALCPAAREAMERARVTDPESAFYGTFSHSDNGSDLQSFDQLLPLLVYCRSSQAKFQ